MQSKQLSKATSYSLNTPRLQLGGVREGGGVLVLPPNVEDNQSYLSHPQHHEPIMSLWEPKQLSYNFSLMSDDM